MSESDIPVPIGECLCLGTPHEDGDFVYLRAKLGLAAGVEISRILENAKRNKLTEPQLTGQLTEGYVKLGVSSWTLVDGDGKPIPVTPDSIGKHLLSDFSRSWNLANRADELYTGPVLDPLVGRDVKSSNSTQTNGSTSAQTNGKPKRPTRSKPSSTSTIPTDATTTISP